MAFRALLSSKSPETNTAMTVACKNTGIRVEACSDIFTAIEKGKTQAFSCIIADWADQPEASFLLKRARESAANRETVAIAIVDNEPTAAEMRDNHLDFLIYRPISAEEADAVLAKALEKMQPLGAHDPAALLGDSDAPGEGSSAASAKAEASDDTQPGQPASFAEENAAGGNGDGETAYDESQAESRSPSHAINFRGVLAAMLVLTAVFCLWRSRDVIQYLSRTREGRVRVLRESVAALFYMNQSGALPVASAGSDAQQDAYFSRVPAASDAQTPALAVVDTESQLQETRAPLPKPSDFPLPVPVLKHDDTPPVRVER